MATFICSDCGRRAAEGGDCAGCGQGPLLDLSNPVVEATLREKDAQRRLKRERLLRVVAIPLAAAPVLAVIVTLPQILLLVPLPIPFADPFKVIVAIVLVALGVSRGLFRLFPAKPLFGDADAPTASTADVATALRRGNTRRVLVPIAVLAGVGLLLVLGIGWMRATEARKRAERSAAVQALRTCLLGDTGAHKDLAAHLRRIELSKGAVAPAPDWPDRCAKYGDALFKQLDTTGKDAHLREVLAGKAGCDTGCDGAEMLASIEAISAATTAADPWADDLPLPEVEGPPLADTHFLTAKDFPALGIKDLRLIDSTVLTTSGVALLYRTAGAELYVCEVDPQRTSVSCNPVPQSARVAAASAKLARGEAEPVLYGITSAKVTGGRDALGIERSPDKPDTPQKTQVEKGAFLVRSGERVSFYHGPHGEGIRNGVLLERSGGDIEAVTVQNGQETGRRKLGSDSRLQGPWVIGDRVAQFQNDAERGALLVRDPSDKNGRRAGEIEAMYSVEPTLCGAGGESGALVLAGSTRTAVSFLGKSGPTAPLAAPSEPKRVAPEPAAPAPKPPKPKPVAAASATAAASASAEPAPSSTGASSGRYAIKGPSDNPDPRIARQAALKDAEEFGMLGLLNSGAGGDPNAPTMPWGRDDSIGSSFGFGGLGGSPRSAPRPSGPAPEAARIAEIDGAEVSCSPGAVARTWVTTRGAITDVHQVRCTAGACAHEVAPIRDLGAKSFWVTTTLGEEVLLVFRGRLGELRMRSARLPDLPAALDVLLLDAPDAGGPETGEIHVLGGALSVMVLFRSDSLFGLRFSPGGKYEVVKPG